MGSLKERQEHNSKPRSRSHSGLQEVLHIELEQQKGYILTGMSGTTEESRIQQTDCTKPEIIKIGNMKKDYLNCKMRLNRSHKHNFKKKPNPCTECVYFQLTLIGTVSPE